MPVRSRRRPWRREAEQQLLVGNSPLCKLVGTATPSLSLKPDGRHVQLEFGWGLCTDVYIVNCPRRPERGLDLLELELQAVVICPVWVLGPSLGLQEGHKHS